MIGWLFNWTRPVPEGAVRAGALSLPRELSLQNGVLTNAPIEEARPLLTEDDECVLRGDGRVKIRNSRRVLLDLPAADVQTLSVFSDTRTKEVFLNGGACSCTFYWEDLS